MQVGMVQDKKDVRYVRYTWNGMENIVHVVANYYEINQEHKKENKCLLSKKWGCKIPMIEYHNYKKLYIFYKIKSNDMEISLYGL